MEEIRIISKNDVQRAKSRKTYTELAQENQELLEENKQLTNEMKLQNERLEVKVDKILKQLEDKK
jgi:hypothetical protein